MHIKWQVHSNMRGMPLGVVTSCRKLAWSLRSGQINPRSSKKGTASLTGPWNISSLQTGTGPLFRQHVMQLKHTMHAHTRGPLSMGMLVPNKGRQHWGSKHFEAPE